MDNQPPSSSGNRLLWLLLVALLCAAVGAAGFFLGRYSVQAEGPAVELVEVTREVTRLPDVAVPAVSEVTAVPTEQPTTPLASPTTIAESPATATPPATVEPVTPAPALQPPEAFDLEEINVELLLEVWQIVVNEFDGNVPLESDVIYTAIDASLERLNDEFTTFIPPDIAARLREDLEGSFEGIGAFVRMNEEGLLEIVRPIADQPAARAGLRPGDVILAVDGVSVVGNTADEIIGLVRGPRGTTVTLTVGREGVEEPFDVTIERQLIEIPLVESEMLPDNIAYVRLSSFSRNAEPQLSQVLGDFLAQNPQALIFDLRDNPGGFLDQAVAVADLFLEEGVVLLERNNRGLDQVFRSESGNLAESIPLVVLVNAGSASASEIVAGAIQDHGRAILIGETTFGKGSVQQSHTLSDDSELRVTIAHWYTPNNHSIDGLGVTPDIEVLPSPIEFRGPDDTQLQRAIEYILNGET